MAVDDNRGGQGLTVSEVNCDSMPLGPDNPYGEHPAAYGMVLLATLLQCATFCSSAPCLQQCLALARLHSD